MRKEARIDASKISQEKRTLAIDESDLARLRGLVQQLSTGSSVIGAQNEVKQHSEKPQARKQRLPLAMARQRAKREETTSKKSEAKEAKQADEGEKENKEGENKEGENKEGENKEGENKEGENKEGENKEGENKEGENKEGEKEKVKSEEEKEKERQVEEAKQRREKELVEWGFHLPDKKEAGSLFWPKGSVLPPVLQELQRMVVGVFSSIKAKDFNGHNITLVPPNSDRNAIIGLDKTGMDVGARLIAVLGSPENLTFRVRQGKIDSEVDISLLRDQVMMIPFGIANSSSFSFNNLNSYLHRVNPSSRGLNRAKQPLNRWLLVVDCLASEDILTQRIKESILAAKRGPQLRKGGANTDLERVISMAEAKAVSSASVSETKTA